MRALALPFGLFLLAGCPSSVLVDDREDLGETPADAGRPDGGVAAPLDGGPDSSVTRADAFTPAADAGVDAGPPDASPGPWAEVDCEWGPVPAIPAPERVLPNGYSGWRGTSSRHFDIGHRRLKIDDDGRFHLVDTHQSGDVVHSHGVPGHWTSQTIHRSPARQDVRTTELALVGGQPHIGYASASAERPTWAHRPCDRADWRLAPTPFLITTNNVRQPAIAFDAATGHLHAVGTTVANVPDWEPTPLATTTLPSSGETFETPAIVSNWVAYSVQAVADAGHLHVLTSDDGGRRALHSRDPWGRWHTHEFHGNDAQIVLGSGRVHVVTFRSLEWAVGADSEVVLLSMDLATHEVRETILPLEAARWDYLDAAAGPGGELHLVADAAAGPVHATNESGDWTAVPIEAGRFQSRPAIAVDRTGRPWFAYSDHEWHWLVAGPD